MPQRLCVTRAVALSVPSSPTATSKVIGCVAPASVRSPCTLIPAAGALHPGRAEDDVLAVEDLVVDRLVDVVLVLVAEGLHPARALAHAQRGRVGGELGVGRLGVPADLERRLPGGDLMSRSWPAFAAAPPRRVCTANMALAGPSRCVPAGIKSAPSIYWGAPRQEHARDGDRAGPPFTYGEADRRELRGDHPTSSASCRAVEGGRVTEVVEPGQGEGRDPDADGRDVDEADRHRRGHRAGPRGPHRARAALRQGVRGHGHANADVTFQLDDGGGTIHTHAQITGKAASMGEGVVIGVLDALITDFTSKLGQI